MTSRRSLEYRFEFEDGAVWNYQLAFDEYNRFFRPPTAGVREWTKLDFCKCPNCPLKSDQHPQCPVAANIDHIVEDSKDVISYTNVTVTVTTPERRYEKKCAAQTGLVSLFGIIMASSECPHLDWLRPLARFHLPFASIEDTLFRVLSLQLLSEFFAKERNESAGTTGMIQSKYDEVATVNRSFIQRIRRHCAGDADKNAIAALDIWVQAFELFQGDFKPLRIYFEPITDRQQS